MLETSDLDHVISYSILIHFELSALCVQACTKCASWPTNVFTALTKSPRFH